MHIEFVAVPLDSPAARPLLDELDDDLAQRYGGGEEIHAAPAEFAPPDGLFVLAIREGEAVACGGFRSLGPTASLLEGRPLRPGIAEIKRMYVRPSARGTGMARRVLAHLETRAEQVGYAQLWLETGTMQPEAMQLYESSGYAPIPGFGQFADSPLSRSYAKRLSPTPNSRAPLS